MTRECVRQKTLLQLKLLIDADVWQFGVKTKRKFYIFYPLPTCSKNVPASLSHAKYNYKLFSPF